MLMFDDIICPFKTMFLSYMTCKNVIRIRNMKITFKTFHREFNGLVIKLRSNVLVMIANMRADRTRCVIQDRITILALDKFVHCITFL